ncbi:glycosyltransferase family 2 protein [candidate division KSB1 bacterium]|nr:glycosyltransferase family 2 protein [candidate division KSB1 bacterium]NIR70409.1 glycosyltransferase family 2 protein [candidate division KSB1 bacterium]NIT69972.1 glycosyltransferase family 2 protein [candidate division KSB1 bacterium]NIU91515.1 glycosyltransferase [candidate division KSB1 bacterium]NIV93833.1 glycosyltransferase [candidate division KSB1 bacterium]
MELHEICVIIPAYNEAQTIADVVSGIKKCHPEVVVIIINDGSNDDTKDAILNQDVIYVEHRRKLGKGAALRTGFNAALMRNMKYVLTMDADGQHSPDDIKSFFRTLDEKHYDLILGSRMADVTSMPFHRRLSNRVTSKLISWRTGCRILDSQCGFRLIHSEVIKSIKLHASGFDCESELLLKAALQGFDIGHTPVKTIYHKSPNSTMNVLTDTFKFIQTYVKSFFW